MCSMFTRPNCLVVGGALLEGAALFGIGVRALPAALLIALHALGAALLGAGLFARLRPAMKADPVGLLCFVALALCVPVVGALGLMVLSCALGRPLSAVPARMRAVPAPSLPPRPPPGLPDPPADSLGAVLWHASDATRRAQALLRAAGIGGPRAVTLLRAGLRDPDEDVRLLAHALLTRRENAGAGREAP